MSLFAHMEAIGRPIAYYPRLAKFFGSVNSSILFSQLFYWQQRSTSDMGVFKTADEWEAETGLSYREQATARKTLVERGFLVETHKRLEHRIYFRLDQDAIDSEFGEWNKAQLASDKAASPELRQPQSTNDENAIGELRNPQVVNRTEITAETTAESTADIFPAAPSAPPAPVASAPAVPVITGCIAKRDRTAKPDTDDETALQAACRATWAAYSEAYAARYGAAPVRNQSVNAKVKQFVQRLGHVEAPDVAAWYVASVNEAFVVRKFHDVGQLLSSAEAYRTQWATGRSMTTTRAKQIDQSQANFSAADEAMAIIRANRGEARA